MKGMVYCGCLIVCLALGVCSPSRLRAGPPLDTSHPVAFFTNLASRLLQAEMNLDLHRLQIHPTNQYTPAVHRLLQVTANLYDAINPTNDTFGPLPTVFRPVFEVVNTNVYLTSFVESPFLDTTGLTPQPLDLSFSNALAFVRSNSLIFGVPLVIGARKGLPNFNEFASESVVQITRKVELVKSGPGGSNRIIQTNQFFTIGISNAFGAEFWNSYVQNYTRPVEIAVTNYCLISLTNDFGFVHRTNLTAFGQVFSNSWPAWNLNDPLRKSFVVPLRTNQIIIPDLVAAQDHRSFVGRTVPSGVTTPSTPVPLAFPRWVLTVTNRVVACVRAANGRLLDFVLLGSMVAHRDLTAEMARYQEPRSFGFDGLWATNSPNGIHLSGLYGVINQIQISKGEIDSGPNEWQNHGLNQPVGQTKNYEIARFLAFFAPDNRATYRGFSAINTNNAAFAPFTPTWKESMPMLWQANDPFIHYTTGDMEYLELSRIAVKWNPPSANIATNTGNLGRVNERYRPWGGNPFTTMPDPNAYNFALKDPLVRLSRDWDFPEGEPLSLGVLRRVHRGTPWQTVYLKSGVVTDALDWPRWTGNHNLHDAEHTQPTRDWKIAALIASLVNTNDPRTLLSINEPDTNVWRVVLDGIVALTNSATDEMLNNLLTQFDPLTIASNSPQASVLAAGIARERERTVCVGGTNVFVHSNRNFSQLGDLLAVPELTAASPFLNHGVIDDYGRNLRQELSLSDEAYERIPVQLLSRLRPDSLGSITREAGGWRIQFTGFDGFRYAVEESTNLLDWHAISTNEPTEGVFEIALPEGAENRFYRSALLP